MDEESAGQKNQNWHYYEAKGLVEIWAKFWSKMMKKISQPICIRNI